MISFTRRFFILNLLLFSKVKAFENQELPLDTYNDLKLKDLQNVKNQTRKAGISYDSYINIDIDISPKCDLR